MPQHSSILAAPVVGAHVDGIHVELRRGRARRFRQQAEQLGLGVPPVERTEAGLHVQLGAAPLWPRLEPLVDLLEAFDARLSRVELAVDYALHAGDDPEAQLDDLLDGLRLRVDPTREWYQPDGLACRYLGPERLALNAAAYTRPTSKIAATGVVAHVEIRLRDRRLAALGLDTPAGLLAWTEADIVRLHRRTFGP